ncbi:MAG: dipeptide ABC transporter ATP-binding protein [Firmicutes bacterium]|nr:dipeptide ABC transporter ATP-binding protein [Bacillota bacterium]
MNTEANVPLLEVKNLRKYFPIYKGVFAKAVGQVKAVDDVSFSVTKGQTLGIVGESGCGKSTTGRTLLRLVEPTAGVALFEGKDIFALGAKEMRALRRDAQIVFQDPFASLNPRKTVRDIINEPLQIHQVSKGKERQKRILELLDVVGLSSSHLRRYPHEFSGGQRQRIGVARALALNPKLIILDEPVSALDVSIQSQIINLLETLQHEFQLTYIFIAHDLAVVRHISDTVAVMYLGRIVETAPADQLFSQPSHPYTQALLSATPEADPDLERNRIVLTGDVPSPLDIPTGCRFHTRCPEKTDLCTKKDIHLFDQGGGHFVACHLRTAASAV